MRRKSSAELVGLRFGKLVVLDIDGRRNGELLVRCQCDCGNTKTVRWHDIQSSRVKACGCLLGVIRATWERHGRTKTPEHITWTNIKDRVFNTKSRNSKRYGQRGITMDDAWATSFEAFFADMGPRPSTKHTIERIDNNGPYCKGNCRWATITEQNRNKSDTRLIDFNGEIHCAAEWATITGITYGALIQRLKHGWSVEAALTRPVRLRAKSKHV